MIEPTTANDSDSVEARHRLLGEQTGKNVADNTADSMGSEYLD